MICTCGLLDIIHQPDRMLVVLSRGAATVRTQNDTVRVEHLDCQTCRGVLLRSYAGMLADCGCHAGQPGVAVDQPSLTSIGGGAGSCSCGALTWFARDRMLALEGLGAFALWDAEPGVVSIVGGYCIHCGSFDVADSGRPQT